MYYIYVIGMGINERFSFLDVGVIIGQDPREDPRYCLSCSVGGSRPFEKTKHDIPPGSYS
jgi:hypothetical protein